MRFLSLRKVVSPFDSTPYVYLDSLFSHFLFLLLSWNERKYVYCLTCHFKKIRPLSWALTVFPLVPFHTLFRWPAAVLCR
jgi:hypothetical protein